MHSNYLHGFAVNNGRLSKARKIEAVLLDSLKSEEKYLRDRQIVDIGCGTGHISAYFSELNNFWATDVVDQISVDTRQKVRFVKSTEESIPFSDQAFEIAILNHVIAHTRYSTQLLKEIFRILKVGGRCYLANPNRLYPFEPFYRLPLLHYLPNGMFFKIAGYLRQNIEKVYLLSWLSLKRLCERTGFDVDDYTVRVINDPQRYFSEFKLPFSIKVPEIATIISPTNIFILRKPI
jgi:ubiquinone/menaquinone biosynthesis C-methylase UbiE